MVSIPADQVKAPWTSASFTATLGDPDPEKVDKILKGIVLRTDQMGGENLQAFCIYCPHEICMVDLKRDTSAIKFERPQEANHPMFVCPCHFSVFDPLRQGASISGPAYRGLYRFDVVETEDSIHISAVEDEVLNLYN